MLAPIPRSPAGNVDSAAEVGDARGSERPGDRDDEYLEGNQPHSRVSRNDASSRDLRLPSAPHSSGRNTKWWRKSGDHRVAKQQWANCGIRGRVLNGGGP